MSRLRSRLQNGEIAVGIFSKITDPAVAEISGYAGLDFIIIDLEHGPASIETAQNIIRAAELGGVAPIIRVALNAEDKVLRALDIGAHGVQVPQINSKDQAEKLVEYSRFGPMGERGMCRYVRAAQYTNREAKDYFPSENEKVLVIGHLEGKEGLENIDSILQVDGLDVIFIGPYDLSQSLGIPGQVDSPLLLEKMQNITQKCKQKGKLVGTFVEGYELAQKWIDAGVTYIAFSVDVGLLYNSLNQIALNTKKQERI